MYLGIDVGGTKTIVASLDDNGVIIEHIKLPTAAKYVDFLEEVSKTIDKLKDKQFNAAVIGIPASEIDRKNGIGIRFGNLAWRNVKVVSDIEKMVDCPVFMENDAKLGALSESMLIKDRFSKVLYLTLGTGIGYAVVDDLKIDTASGDGGGRLMLVRRDNKLVPWETIASGHAISELYGKMAKDIEDAETWKKISNDLAEGLEELIAVFQPQVIVVGGSVGNYFSRFGEPLKEAVNSYPLALVSTPEFLAAQRPDEAVIYGCYDYAKQMLSSKNE